jgi:hypothetical protein
VKESSQAATILVNCSTVSQSQLDDVRAYIRSQPEHHRTKTFAAEYRAFLARYYIEYDERYLLG